MERQLEKKEELKINESASGESSIATPLFTNLTSFLSVTSLRQLYRETGIVRRCVDHIAESVANLPREYDVKFGLKKDEVVKTLFQRKTVTGETFRDTLVAMCIDLLVLNKGVLVPLYTVGKKLTGFTARDAATFHPVYEKDGRLRGYIQQVNLGRVYKFRPEEIIFVQLVPRTYRGEGIPILESLTYEIASLLKNLVKSDPDTRKPIGTFIFQEHLDEDVVNRFQEDLTSLVSGNRVKIPIVWGAGKGEWIELVKQFDIQMVSTFLDRLDWMVRSAFGFVPPGSSLLEARSGSDLMFSTLVPQVAKAVEDKLNRFLESYGITLTFKIPPAHTLERIIEGTKSGLIAPNEARQFMNLPPIKGGDQVSVMQPKGLTPVGKAPEAVPLSASSSAPEEIERSLTLEEARQLKNLALLTDEKTARFVLRRVKLLQQMQQDLKKVVLDYRRKFEEKTILRQVAGTLPSYALFLLELDQVINLYQEDALSLGFERVRQYWKATEYDEENVRQEINEYSKRLKSETLRNWKDRLDTINNEATRGKWDQVKKDLDNLVKSIVAAAGLVTLFANLPLISIARMFEETQGVMLRWVGVSDEKTCEDCAALQGRVFRPSMLELLQTWPGYGVRCGHNCRCALEPTSEISLSAFNKWIGKVIPIRNLHVLSAEVMSAYSEMLSKLDKKFTSALKESPHLREPGYIALFKDIKLSKIDKPQYDAITNVLEIPEHYTASQIRNAFADATAINILFRNDLLNPTSPFSSQVQSLLVKVRQTLWDDYLKDVIPSELKDAWLEGDAAAFEGMSLSLFDLPQKAYFDPREFFVHMFKASIFSPNREDIVGMKAFRELLGSTFWSPTSYEKWLDRVYRVRPIPWRATRSVDQIISSLEYVDPRIEPYLRDLLARHPMLRVSSFWDGLQGIKFASASRYNATYALEVDYKDFVKSFTGTIESTGDPYQLLHEIGHHVFERHFTSRSLMRDAFAYVYRERILIPFYEQVLPYLSEDQAKKFMGYMSEMLDATENRTLGSFFLGSREVFAKEIFEPIYPGLQSMMKNWALPIRPYTLRSIDETFAEVFATYMNRPSVLYFSDPELYVFMESLLQNLAVRPETLISKHPLWERVFEAAMKAGLTREQVKKLTPRLLWAHIKADVGLDELVALFEGAATEGGAELRKLIKKEVESFLKAPEKKSIPSKERRVTTSKAKEKAPLPKKTLVTLKDVHELVSKKLKIKGDTLEEIMSKIVSKVMDDKISLTDLYSKLDSFKSTKEAKQWLTDFLKK